ncbi:hypothetical protein CDAR_28001 [Caerostris darwini]|uniref:Uncharacterized protein n=1 Tax=Caerostris darwini TaxID=1538125 RepID=A0AAV4QRT5_9ARAC|nr:hypothetical protein CDAR_28001 [Caerostris darwini]
MSGHPVLGMQISWIRTFERWLLDSNPISQKLTGLTFPFRMFLRKQSTADETRKCSKFGGSCSKLTMKRREFNGLCCVEFYDHPGAQCLHIITP